MTRRRSYVNVRHYLLVAADIQTCTQPLKYPFYHLPPSEPGGSRCTVLHYSVNLYFSGWLFYFLSPRLRVSFSHGGTPTPRRSPLSFFSSWWCSLSLSPAVTNKSKLSPAEKNARRFPERRKAGFLGVICGDRSLNSPRQWVGQS